MNRDYKLFIKDILDSINKTEEPAIKPKIEQILKDLEAEGDNAP